MCTYGAQCNSNNDFGDSETSRLETEEQWLVNWCVGSCALALPHLFFAVCLGGKVFLLLDLSFPSFEMGMIL